MAAKTTAATTMIVTNFLVVNEDITEDLFKTKSPADAVIEITQYMGL